MSANIVNQRAVSSAIELLSVVEHSVASVDPALRPRMRDVLRGLLFSQLPQTLQPPAFHPSAPSMAASDTQAPSVAPPPPPAPRPKIRCTCPAGSAAHKPECAVLAAHALCNCVRARFGGTGRHNKTCPRSTAHRFPHAEANNDKAAPPTFIDADAPSQGPEPI